MCPRGGSVALLLAAPALSFARSTSRTAQASRFDKPPMLMKRGLTSLFFFPFAFSRVSAMKIHITLAASSIQVNRGAGRLDRHMLRERTPRAVDDVGHE